MSPHQKGGIIEVDNDTREVLEQKFGILLATIRDESDCQSIGDNTILRYLNNEMVNLILDESYNMPISFLQSYITLLLFKNYESSERGK